LSLWRTSAPQCSQKKRGFFAIRYSAFPFVVPDALDGHEAQAVLGVLFTDSFFAGLLVAAEEPDEASLT